MECYVGLDLHSKASVFVLQDEHGQVQARGEMPTTPDGFRRWHEAQHLPAGTPVALETGPVAFFVARELTGLGCEPSPSLLGAADQVHFQAHGASGSGGGRGRVRRGRADERGARRGTVPGRVRAVPRNGRDASASRRREGIDSQTLTAGLPPPPCAE